MLTEEQIDWLIKAYPNTSTKVIAEKLGVSVSAVHSVASRRKVRKSEEYMKQVISNMNDASVQNYWKNGATEKQKAHYERLRRMRIANKGKTRKDLYGEARATEIGKACGSAQREHFRKERIRISWGLPQRTKLKVINQGRKKVNIRYELRKGGYIEDVENHTFYYPPNIVRQKVRERNATKKYNIKFKPLSDETN